MAAGWWRPLSLRPARSRGRACPCRPASPAAMGPWWSSRRFRAGTSGVAERGHLPAASAQWSACPLVLRSALLHDHAVRDRDDAGRTMRVRDILRAAAAGGVAGGGFISLSDAARLLPGER